MIINRIIGKKYYITTYNFVCFNMVTHNTKIRMYNDNIIDTHNNRLYLSFNININKILIKI